MKKLLNIILTIFLIAGFACTSIACGDDAEAAKTPYNKEVFADGIHNLYGEYSRDFEDDSYLVKDNATDYVLVIRENPSEYVSYARDEFMVLFRKATGITIGIKYASDADVEYSANAKYICLGFNELYEEACEAENFEISDEEMNKLGRDGVRIKTLGKSIFILRGTSDFGVLYGVYDFMQIYFNFDSFYRNAIRLDATSNDIKLKDFNVSDVPDILNRVSPSAAASPRNNIRDYELANGIETNEIPRTADRFRFVRGSWGSGDNTGGLLMRMPENINNPSNNGEYIHNSPELVSPYDAQNPLYRDYVEFWESQNGGDHICPTARGNEEYYNKFVSFIADKCMKALTHYDREKFPETSYISITGEDTGTWCDCDACTAFAEEACGSHAGAYLRLAEAVANEVHRRIGELPDDDFRKNRTDFKVVIFAYGFTYNPCTYYDSKLGKYVLWDGREKTQDNVVVWVCQGLSKNIYDYSDSALSIIQAWSDVATELWYYDYGAYYSAQAYLCDSYAGLNSDKFQYLANRNWGMYYNQINYSSPDQMSFEGLKSYLMAKLMWDSTLNTDDLMDAYFDGMYGVASSIMREAFDRERLVMNLISTSNGYEDGKGFATDMITKKYWHYSSILKPQIDIFNEALAAIEIYRGVDPKQYELIKSRILIEKLGPLYKILSTHCLEDDIIPFSTEQRMAYLQEAMDICYTYTPGIDINHNADLSDVFKSLL